MQATVLAPCHQTALNPVCAGRPLSDGYFAPHLGAYARILREASSAGVRDPASKQTLSEITSGRPGEGGDQVTQHIGQRIDGVILGETCSVPHELSLDTIEPVGSAVKLKVMNVPHAHDTLAATVWLPSRILIVIIGFLDNYCAFLANKLNMLEPSLNWRIFPRSFFIEISFEVVAGGMTNGEDLPIDLHRPLANVSLNRHSGIPFCLPGRKKDEPTGAAEFPTPLRRRSATSLEAGAEP
jgi:hypothetical protein